ncbi:unnamed protein product, partial [Ectocarpus sp. 12 AP-2014]
MGAALRIAVGTKMGDNSPLFTVEPGGFLRLESGEFSTPLEGGTTRDTNSRLRVEKGGELQVWGKTWFTKSAITFMRPCTKDRYYWIRNNRRWNERRWTWGQWNRHHQQQQQRSGAQPAGAMTARKPQPPFCSPFGPKVSAEYTFWERFDISPSYLKELRYPSSMTSRMDGSVLSMGVDGTLLHATEDRQNHFRLEMKTAVEAAEAAEDLDEHERKTAVLDISADGVDPDNERLQLKTLVVADPAKAMAALMHRPAMTVGGGLTWSPDEVVDAALHRESSRMRDTLLGRTANGRV